MKPLSAWRSRQYPQRGQEAVLRWLLGALLLSGCSKMGKKPSASGIGETAESMAGGASEPCSLDESRIPELTSQATGYMFRGCGPAKAEKEAAEAAMRVLKSDKKRVTAFILKTLSRTRGPWRAPSLGEVSPAHYGLVLREFGPDYLCALEPTVLQADGEWARRYGVYILGMAGGYGLANLLVPGSGFLGAVAAGAGKQAAAVPTATKYEPYGIQKSIQQKYMQPMYSGAYGLGTDYEPYG